MLFQLSPDMGSLLKLPSEDVSVGGRWRSEHPAPLTLRKKLNMLRKQNISCLQSSALRVRNGDKLPVLEADTASEMCLPALALGSHPSEFQSHLSLTRKNKYDYALSSFKRPQSWHMAGAQVMLTVPSSLGTSRLGARVGVQKPGSNCQAEQSRRAARGRREKAGAPAASPPPGGRPGQRLTESSPPPGPGTHCRTRGEGHGSRSWPGTARGTACGGCGPRRPAPRQ